MDKPILLEYVRSVAARIIAEKIVMRTTPAACTLNEIVETAKTDILEAMRELHALHEYRGTRNVNFEPMLMINDNHGISYDRE